MSLHPTVGFEFAVFDYLTSLLLCMAACRMLVVLVVMETLTTTS
jgi:hypothetical protein